MALVRQAEDRAHRQGQTNCVNVYFLCAKGTCDDHKWQYLCRNLDRISVVHDGGKRGEAPGLSASVRMEEGGLKPWASGFHLDGIYEVGCADDVCVDFVDGLKDVKGRLVAGMGDGSSDCDERMNGGQHLRGLESVASAADGEVGTQTRQPDVGASGSSPRLTLDQRSGRTLTDMWFEVSEPTGRVHLHFKEDGSQLLGLSIPIAALLADGAPALSDLRRKLLDADSDSPDFVKGPFGLHCNGAKLKGVDVDAMLQRAKDFATEWNEVRSVHKNKLYGKVRSAEGWHPKHAICFLWGMDSDRTDCSPAVAPVHGSDLLGGFFDKLM